MAFHPTIPLTLSQLQTPANQAARDAAKGGAFPGPVLPSQQFTIQGGLQQLNSEESEMLQNIVNRLKNRREQISTTQAPVQGNVGSALGNAFLLRG